MNINTKGDDNKIIWTVQRASWDRKPYMLPKIPTWRPCELYRDKNLIVQDRKTSDTITLRINTLHDTNFQTITTSPGCLGNSIHAVVRGTLYLSARFSIRHMDPTFNDRFMEYCHMKFLWKYEEQTREKVSLLTVKNFVSPHLHTTSNDQ